jgi:WD40 repeat protein
VDGIPRIFAEFVEGGTLFDWMQNGKLYEGGQALERILDIAIQVAWGLHHAHEHGVIHQDVKPGNVMLQGPSAKVTDFGLARAWESATRIGLDPSVMSMAVSLGGITPAYCSPEQLEAAVQAESQIPQRQRTKITRRTDIWSWGLTVFAMFFGKAPCRYGGQTAPQTLKSYLERSAESDDLPSIPPSLAMLLGRCFQVDPEGRPTSMAEVADRCKDIYRELIGVEYPRREPVSTDLMANSLNNRAASLLDLGKQQESAKLLEEAWQRHPWQPQVTYNRGLLAWRTGQITDVELVTQLEELCKMRPRQWAASYALGLIQLERGEVSVAIRVLKQAVQLGGGADVRAALDQATAVLDRAPGCVRAFTGQPPHLTNIFVSQNSQCVVSGVDESTFQLWESASGRPLLSIGVPRDGPAYSSDGRWELKTTGRESLRLVDSTSARRTTKFRKITWGPSPVAGASSKGGRWRLVEGELNAFEIRDAVNGSLVRKFRGHTRRVNSVSFTANARWVLSGGQDKTIRLWEVGTGRCVRTLKGHTDSVTRVYLSSSGSWALSESSGRRLHLWSLELFSSDSHRFVAPILMCDVTSSETAGHAQQQFVDLANRARGALGGRDYGQALELVRAARDLPGYEMTRETRDLWDAVGRHCVRSGCRDGWCVHILEGHHDDVRSVAMSRDSRWILSASNDLSLRQWEASLGQCVRTMAGHTDWVRSVCFGPDGQTALSASYDRTLRTWDLAKGVQIKTLSGHDNHVTCAALSADGTLAYSGSWDTTLRVWDVAGGRCLKALRGHTNYVVAVCPTADGRQVLSGSDDKTIRLWEVVTGQILMTFSGHDDWVQSVSLSADAALAISGSKDRTMRLWDTTTGDCLRVFEGHRGAVSSVALSADGRWAVSGSQDGTVRLWGVETGECQHVFEGHTAAVHSVFLSENCRWLVSGGEDRAVRVWEIDWDYQVPG